MAAVGGLLLALSGASSAAAATVPRRVHLPAVASGRAHVASPRAAAVRGAIARGGKVRLAVSLAPGADPASVAAAAGEGNGLAHRLSMLHSMSLSVPQARVAAVTRALSRRHDVLRVEAVPLRHTFTDPNDPYYSSQQGYLSAISAPQAWAITHGAASVKVAVVDSGVDVSHPDLAAKIAGVHNATSLGTPTDVSDAVGHGTHVAGIIAAASNNGVGVTGTGYDTSLLAVKAGDVDGFSDDDLAAGIVWATNNGARVINMSLGGPGTTTVLSDAVSYAQTHDVLVVAAAGNDGVTTQNYPAALPGVIAVGATNGLGSRADFSNYGSWVSVGAPGTSIWSTVPTAGSEVEPAPSDGYAALDGTSMASPIVAGEAALLLGLEPWLTQSQLRNAIVSSTQGSTLGFGKGQVDLAAAFDKIPPATVPALTAPSASATVGGVVPLAASTTAGSVQFLVDGTPVGARSSATSGSAGATWESWGTAEGAHEIAAQDCNSFGCGAPSSPVGVTVHNVTPTIASPVDGTTVSNSVSVAIAVTDAAPRVQLRVDGVALGTPVPVTAGSASVSWPTAGWANGAHAVTAAACTSSGACGPAGTGLSLQVNNAAPVITSPHAGQLVSGSFTLAATSSSGALQFLVDGKQVGFDGSSPYTAPVNFSTYVDGSHVLKIQPCTATKSFCAGPSVSRTITVKSLHPSITRAAPAVFSPNGDKRADTTVLTYALPDTESSWWGIKNGSGAVVRGPYYLGTVSKGSRTFLWNGNLANGTRAPNGTYTAYVTTKAVVSGSTLYGYATRYVRLDTVAPSLSVVGPATGFYPYTDGYRDTVVAKATTNEPGLLSLAVRNTSGRVVRTVSVNHSYTGTYALTWNGRDSTGHLVPAGTYRLQVTTQDVALNRRISPTYSVVVSLKKLVGTVVSKVVTPAASHTSILAGTCSEVAASSTWSGGYDYLSDYDCYDPYDSTAAIAASDHSFTLPGAVKYASLYVTITGQERLSGYGDQLFAWYRDPGDNLMDPGVTCGPAYGTRSIGAASSSYLYGGRTLRWTVATTGGMYYSVRAFTVHYTYYVLK